MKKKTNKELERSRLSGTISAISVLCTGIDRFSQPARVRQNDSITDPSHEHQI